MMVVSEEPKLIVEDIIYKPKPKNIYKLKLQLHSLSNYTKSTHAKTKHHLKYKKHDEKRNLNLKKNRITKSQNFDLISFEEIENDFKELKARTERKEIENELLEILENSTKDTSFDEKERKNEKNKIKKVERPKNILYNYYNI